MMSCHRLPVAAVILLGLSCAGASAPPEATDASYVAEVDQWHAEREERLTAEDGWTTLVGLSWLEPGENAVGTAPDSAVVLPRGPAALGTYVRAGDSVRFVAQPDAGVTHDGQPVDEVDLPADGDTVILRHDSVSFFVIRRGDRIGVRVKDSEAATRKEFRGIERFPVDRSWRYEARFTPDPEPVPITNVLGQVSDVPSPGTVTFERDGETWTLRPLRYEGSDDLFFVFGDGTSARETYGGGRFLSAELPADGTVVVDFNRAYNPPCAFTPYATCPLPPEENRLALEVKAGEKTYAVH